MKYKHVLAVLERHGFECIRQESSHRRYKAIIDGEVRLVTIAFHNINDEARPGTLAAIIRASGLKKRDFL